jgi:hypothetical protein
MAKERCVSDLQPVDFIVLNFSQTTGVRGGKPLKSLKASAK